MFTFLLRLFALIGFLIVAGVVTVGVMLWEERPALPDRIVLDLDLDRPLAEISAGSLGSVFGHEASLRDLLDVIERARTDDRVKGLIASFGDDGFGFAQAQELRAAIERFRNTGRFAIAYADGFGEAGAANRSYLLASAFDEIWVQPLGTVGLTGLSAQVPFARAALDELGVQPQVQQRERYKSFGETLTERDFTPAHREMMTALIGDLSTQVVDAVAQGRRLAPQEVRALIDRAPLLDREALAGRLIDRIGYRDEAEAEALRRAGGGEFVDPLDYLEVAGGPHDEGPTIALIHAVGVISRGDTDEGKLGEPDATARRLVAAFDDAVADKDVVGILFRIDSGGGAVSASETIRRAVVKAREAGKPVVVSMGDTAASGGYWIAMNADGIVAAPGTLTGSIGVVVGKVAVRGLSERLGVHWGVVQEGRNAGLWSPLDPFTDSQNERVTALIDSAYAAFLSKVAEARGLSEEAARSAAQGRVWTGAQAHRLGLVDELGDQETALARLRTKIGLKPGAPVTLTPFPPPKSPLEEIYALATGRSELAEGARALLTQAAALKPLARALAPLLDTTSGEPQMRMPPTGLLPTR